MSGEPGALLSAKARTAEAATPGEEGVTATPDGVMATINQTLNADVAREVGKLFGYDVSFGGFEDMTIESEFEIDTSEKGFKKKLSSLDKYKVVRGGAN